MSITKFVAISCDVKECKYKTALLDIAEYPEVPCEGVEEHIRAEQGFSFVDVPFSNHPDMYICLSCLNKLSGETSG